MKILATENFNQKFEKLTPEEQKAINDFCNFHKNSNESLPADTAMETLMMKDLGSARFYFSFSKGDKNNLTLNCLDVGAAE